MKHRSTLNIHGVQDIVIGPVIFLKTSKAWTRDITIKDSAGGHITITLFSDSESGIGYREALPPGESFLMEPAA
jgi:hypothetical protein